MHLSRLGGSLAVVCLLVPACTTPMVVAPPDAAGHDSGLAPTDSGPTCPAGQVDLDHSAANGCEYACMMTSSTDQPDSTFADANCDGIDGVVATGVFVSPSGVDTNPGTMAMPVLTITHGIMLAHTSHGDVYVDHGTYAESLMLVDGVGVYGGYDRTVSRPGAITGYWDRRADATTTIMGGATAVEATGITTHATLDRLTIHAADGTMGHSSIVVWAHGSTGMLTVSASTLVAGVGAPGVVGMMGANGMVGGNGAPGGVAGTSPCMGPAGGMGGTGGGPGTIGTAGMTGGAYAGPPIVAGGMGGAFGIPSGGGPICGTSGSAQGQLGQSGTIGAPGMVGAPGTGTGTAGTDGAWAAGTGSAGAAGAPGTGGGGGGGGAGSNAGCFTPASGGPGGGGGAGGCGGGGGQGGGGGGGSFGVLAIDAVVVASNDDVTTVAGGDGANGGTGGASGGPGSGGPGISVGSFSGRGGDGGRGAPGGRGGGGGAGGGGPSFCLAHGGTGSLMNTGSVLHPGAGGHAATVPAVATDGVSAPTHEL